MTRRKFIASLSAAAATVIVPQTRKAAASEPPTPQRLFPRHRITVLDSTFIDQGFPNKPLWPSALPGANRSLMMGSILTTPRGFGGSERVLEVANACKSGQHFVNYAFGGPPYRHSYGPREFGLINLD